MSDPQGALEPYRLPPRRHRVQVLHGPWVADGPCWLDPTSATERWAHGRLVAVTSEARRSELEREWGRERVVNAELGPLTVAPLTSEDRADLTAARRLAWSGVLQRAFDHAGCKAAHVAELDRDTLGGFDAIGEALLAARDRPRAAVLRQLLETYGGDTRRLHAALDAVDRALDADHQESPWIFDTVPDHCLRLGPLRNLMRLAERRGVLFRAMSFGAYEAENSFVPDLPIACLDKAIYGGGFDHDLFHHLLPVAPSGDPFHFEASLLVVESAAQAFNSLVLASRYDGPTYEGHATWPGAALFDRLAACFGRRTVPELIGAHGLLGLVCHPDLKVEHAAAWEDLVPNGYDLEQLRLLTDEHTRYVRLDAGWLRSLRPRYEAPMLQTWAAPLADRIASSPGAVVRALHDLLWDLEDIDLRRHDCALVGEASAHWQRGRWAWMRALELAHLLRRSRAPIPAPLQDALGALVHLDAEQREHVAACVHLTGQRPPARCPDGLERRCRTHRDLQARVARETARVEAVAETLRADQRDGALDGPTIPTPFVTTYRELFADTEYQLPVHLGADGPGAPP